ncbi:putative mitochondrial protein, partial [Tanacetum coccineum]
VKFLQLVSCCCPWGCDMVVGIQWLSTLRDIKCNFKELKMGFKYNGKYMTLRGTKQDKEIQVPSLLDQLLENYGEVFEIPTELPPKRSHDHKIPLKKGTQPIHIRPYRHPPTQKDAIETMVKELSDSGVIRHIQSSFSSPVVMVKKKDGSWRIPDMESHVFHLSQVLEVMKRQQLYEKRSYYRRFVKGYAAISRPLTTLLKKNAFGWNSDAQTPFEELKIAMASVQVLQMPDFDKNFSPKHQILSTYKKEFLAVILGLEKWRGYLLDIHSIIKTDQFSLKYLLDQRITIHTQMKWLPKLMGFDYEIVYKKGVENVVADPLSRVQQEATLLQVHVTALYSKLYARIQLDWANYVELQAKITRTDYVAKAFLDNIYKLHGLPKIIVSDKDAVFMSRFWKELFARLQTTPFQAVYGQPPPTHISYNKGDSMVKVVNRSLVTREAAIKLLKFQMKRAHDRMKSLADKNRSEREFDLETWIIQKIGKVAYKLQLPESSQIHHVFHVSQLKKYKGPTPKGPGKLSVLNIEGLIIEEPFLVLDRRMAKRGKVAAVYVLIQCVNGFLADAT